MKLVARKDETNEFWVYAKNEKEMAKVIDVCMEMESYGYAICHIDEGEFFVMMNDFSGSMTQKQIREDYSAAKESASL